MKARQFSDRILVVLLTSVAAGALLVGISYYFYCPCERTPGGWLLGNEITEPVQDWSFANEVGLCQVQVSAVLPHSVNLNCMSSNGQLYLSCSRCDGKYWSTAAMENSQARIRVDKTIYPVKITRVLDPAVLDEAWTARATKLGRPTDRERPEHWWSFNLVSR